jgi:hypothetical protein
MCHRFVARLCLRNDGNNAMNISARIDVACIGSAIRIHNGSTFCHAIDPSGFRA